MKRLILLILALMVAVALCHKTFQKIFEWKTIDVQWETDEEQKSAVEHFEYIATNNYLATVKFWKDKMYLTIPRWKDGVPVTLGVTSATPVKNETAPKLKPFPDDDMQKLDNCYAFQLVNSIEIDPKGRMWVLDNGRPHTLRKFQVDCPARLVILDLENNNKILRIYEFPDNVARHDTSYLNDIVLDHEDGGMAYISDNDQKDPGIIVYTLKNNTSWKVRHDSMKAKSEAVSFIVGQRHVILRSHIKGIALSSASSSNRKLYYSPLSSFHLYSIPVSALKRNATNLDSHVRELGRKNSQTDGMIISSKNVLYFGLLADDTIIMWDIKNSSSFTIGQRVMWRNHVLMQWPESFAFDESGNLWCVVNTKQNFLSGHVDVDTPNFRLIKTHLGVQNYQYYENGTAPELPDISAGAYFVSFALATLLSVILLLVTK